MEEFYRLVDELAGLPEPLRAAAQERIRARFEADRAVLVLDMSGFSLSVRRGGIIAHLARIRRVQKLAGDVVARLGGEVVKCEADNVLAVFPEAAAAVRAALAINEAVRASRAAAAWDAPPDVSIGIDHGRILLIAGREVFGDAVNVAHKLGEDVAGPAEILATDRAMALAGREAFAAEPLALSISGLELEAWRIHHAPA